MKGRMNIDDDKDYGMVFEEIGAGR